MIGDRVKQARLLASLTQQELADQLGELGYQVTKAAISKYENNKSVPPAQFLLTATTVLEVPSTYFTHEPTTQVKWLAFRRHSRLPQKEQEAVQAYASDIAELQIELQTLLHPDAKPDLPAVQTVTTFEEAEAAAIRLRDKWDLDDYPVDSLVQTAEDRQVVVIGWDRNGGKFDGLSGWCNTRPVTVMSTDVDVDRRRFSLAHEIGHLMMDTGSVSDKDAERLAHRFAAAFLVPADRAFHELGSRRTQLDLGELMILKRKYGLSIVAWLFRARDLNIITEHHYTLLQKEISARGWRKKEPVEYIGDEEPIQLQQMARRAVAEGLMSPDRITRVCPNCLEHESTATVSKDYPTASQLLAMNPVERERLMSQMFEWAKEENFEVFEAYGEEEF
jgi:Zn-dependent peptidase ImmA (M78 family)